VAAGWACLASGRRTACSSSAAAAAAVVVVAVAVAAAAVVAAAVVAAAAAAADIVAGVVAVVAAAAVAATAEVAEAYRAVGIRGSVEGACFPSWETDLAGARVSQSRRERRIGLGRLVRSVVANEQCRGILAFLAAP
jgi:hypothetical protein